MIDLFFECFSIGHPKFNANTVKIVRAIVSSRENDIEELLKLQLLAKINGIMADVVQKNPEWCSDHLMTIMNEMLHLAAELKKHNPESRVPQKVFDSLLANFESF